MKGNKQRTQEPTAANQTSSRSHAVLQVAVRQQSRCRDVLQEVRFARLFMIDLAGSERAAQVCGAGGPDRLLGFPTLPLEGTHTSVWRFSRFYFRYSVSEPVNHPLSLYLCL